MAYTVWLNINYSSDEYSCDVYSVWLGVFLDIGI